MKLTKAEKKKLKKAWEESSDRVMGKIKEKMTELSKDEKLKKQMEKEINQWLTGITSKVVEKREEL